MEAGIFNIHTLFVALISQRPPTWGVRALLETGCTFKPALRGPNLLRFQQELSRSRGGAPEQELSLNRAFVLIDTVVWVKYKKSCHLKLNRHYLFLIYNHLFICEISYLKGAFSDLEMWFVPFKGCGVKPQWTLKQIDCFNIDMLAHYRGLAVRSLILQYTCLWNEDSSSSVVWGTTISGVTWWNTQKRDYMY